MTTESDELRNFARRDQQIEHGVDEPR